MDEGPMMTDAFRESISVYRLLPVMGDFRTFLFDGPSLGRLIKYQISGSPSDRPADFQVEWSDDLSVRATEFPSTGVGAPVLSKRIADHMRVDLSTAGSFVIIDGVDTKEYLLYLVEKVADCVDKQRSSEPKRLSGEMKKTVFRTEALPVDLPAFRVPECPEFVYWNGWAVKQLADLVGDDLETRLVWSEDPALTSHPDPWGVL
jgi:hypothetical protein